VKIEIWRSRKMQSAAKVLPSSRRQSFSQFPLPEAGDWTACLVELYRKLYRELFVQERLLPEAAGRISV
jgi:hypothetical protein